MNSRQRNPPIHPRHPAPPPSDTTRSHTQDAAAAQVRARDSLVTGGGPVMHRAQNNTVTASESDDVDYYAWLEYEAPGIDSTDYSDMSNVTAIEDAARDALLARTLEMEFAAYISRVQRDAHVQKNRLDVLPPSRLNLSTVYIEIHEDKAGPYADSIIPWLELADQAAYSVQDLLVEEDEYLSA